MDLEGASRELYGLAPSQFTAAREAKMAEARSAGDRELAAALKSLRKPSVGAWLANLVVRERPRDVDHLIALGSTLQSPKSKLDGEKIRKVSKEKGAVVSGLVRSAESIASRMGHPASPAALEDLAGSLEAAFADSEAAELLQAGRLTSGLHYSGLGLATATQVAPAARVSSSAAGSASQAVRALAQRDLEKANRDLETATAELAKARRAVADATIELRGFKSAEALAVRRSREAEKRVVAAKKKLDRK
jgi:hypothetical protein